MSEDAVTVNATIDPSIAKFVSFTFLFFSNSVSFKKDKTPELVSVVVTEESKLYLDFKSVSCEDLSKMMHTPVYTFYFQNFLSRVNRHLKSQQ